MYSDMPSLEEVPRQQLGCRLGAVHYHMVITFDEMFSHTQRHMELLNVEEVD